MRNAIALPALAALVASPLLLASTDADASCRSRKNTGTLLGGVSGALIGNSISHGGGGAVIGGLGGAVVGHEIAESGCDTRRTYRRSNSHTSRSHQAAARASSKHEPARKVYYDRYGNPVKVSHDDRR
jgi:uncharacterized protein YcfJ